LALPANQSLRHEDVTYVCNEIRFLLGPGSS
jgi:hypothetical protein